MNKDNIKIFTLLGLKQICSHNRTYLNGYNKMNKEDIKTYDIEYKNSDIYNNFSKPSNGFGFSNFQVNNSTYENSQLLEPTTQYDNPVSSYDHGRKKEFFFRDKFPEYKMTDTSSKKNKYYDVLKTQQELNPLIYAFLSQKNIDYVQQLIICIIKKLYNYDISPQNEIELVNIMRAVYLQSKNNNPMAKGDDLIMQVCKLNKDTIDQVVPIIADNIQSYLCYVRDKSTNPYTVNHPVNVSTKGFKNLNGFDKLIV